MPSAAKKIKRIVPPCGGEHSSVEAGRCAACEVIRLTNLNRAQDELLSGYRNKYMIYEWAFRQALRLLRKGISAAKVEEFLGRIESRPGVDPAYFEGVEDVQA